MGVSARRDGGPRTSIGTGSSTRIAWPATFARKRNAPLRADHLRYVRQTAERGELHCFVLDCSASMLGGERFALAKGLLVRCFDSAARARVEVALVSFGGVRADVRFGPGVPRWWNERWLAPVGGGGGTPFALGLRTAGQVLQRAARRQPAQHRALWILTDGRSSERPAKPAWADRIVFVDFEREVPALQVCGRLAQAWDAEWVRAQALTG
ncbi:VWA domain-containing protein [Paraburkholderia kururiensis]|uniref:vWA domain-containing protein n=1 Tax=Paraburkholderia kururiensis TaxID=984307 RepID=UPI000F8602AF